ncbi:MalY/PatB family protein [Peribacillus simplex]|uniref:cysteine-S-conjugate beta-lyase n=1 Tax=Peribacillus simplex TaxID=1478 RepID=A0AAW7IIE6_9BACI|nr:MalY/PatB family protein [Peribacillus simplex]AMM91880.1 cystathionine beta-lyase [Peribacillus simplex]MDM5296141.1 MalY/PatB family protein [Peribacillus simplex]MDM5455149.1 MalY/PatB family protein [Peribacillus simplex]
MKYNFDQEIRRLNTDCEKWDKLESQFGVKDVIPMWVADMDFQSPQPIIEALKQRVEHGVYGYTLRPDSYMESIVSWLKRRHRWSIEKEWITHSPGVIPALSLAIQSFTQKGDKIIIQPPVYHHFARVIQANGREIVNNPLKLENGHYSIDFADLEAKMDSTVKMLILCSPHNPIGRVWSKEELTRLGQICMKHNILVVADEIHCDFVYKTHTHIPFASISEEFANHSLTCIAPSKTFNLMGVQTSSIIIPNQQLRDRYDRELNTLSIGSPNIFGVVALEAAYRHGEEWLDQLLEYLQGNLEFTLNYFSKSIPQIKVIQPEGTYLVWLDCRELGFSVKELDEFMLRKARVAMNEGLIFGMEGEGFMRLNIACPRSMLKNALDGIEKAISSLCKA